MNVENLKISLHEIAKELRPVARSAFISLTKLASEWNIEVHLQFYSSDSFREAQSDLNTSRPRILVYRKSNSNGIMQITPDNEHLLKPRERFSVAHEFGHCVAFNKHQFVPIQESADRTEYWKQERCMDEFAESLLVPRWLAKRWLHSVPDHEPIPPNLLRVWASQSCGISNEVVASALARIDSYIGFLKIAEAERVSNKEIIFIVYFAVHGTDVNLPNRHSFIDDQSFVKIVGRSKAGSTLLESCYLGQFKYQNLYIAWQQTSRSPPRRRKEFSSTIKLSERSFWLSARAFNHVAAGEPDLRAHPKQFSLFD